MVLDEQGEVDNDADVELKDEILEDPARRVGSEAVFMERIGGSITLSRYVACSESTRA